MKAEDTQYMRMAIELALKGMGRVNPNPLVGAVIVKDGAVIGQGYHQQYGSPHAERNALAACTESPAGATVYLTSVHPSTLIPLSTFSLPVSTTTM